jgi:excisionase family DNA binding protein
MEKLLKAHEVADRLALSRSQAYLLMKTNKIPTVKIGKSIRVRSEDLEDFILTHRETDEPSY